MKAPSMTGTSNINYLSISLPDGQDASSSSISDPLKNPINNKKDFHVHESLSEVPDGFEPPIRELQSHALPLGYGTIIFILNFPEAVLLVSGKFCVLCKTLSKLESLDEAATAASH